MTYFSYYTLGFCILVASNLQNRDDHFLFALSCFRLLLFWEWLGIDQVSLQIKKVFKWPKKWITKSINSIIKWVNVRFNEWKQIVSKPLVANTFMLYLLE